MTLNWSIKYGAGVLIDDSGEKCNGKYSNSSGNLFIALR